MFRRTNDGGADMAPGSRSNSDVGADRIGQLLAAKLAAPLLHSGIVSRERLTHRLDENGAKRLSVIVAPAGWGKTTMLAEWARRTRDRQPVAWLTLDETDDETQRFWTYVVTAMLTATPGLGEAAPVALRVPGIDPINVALPALLNDLRRGANAIRRRPDARVHDVRAGGNLAYR
jgi:ATP/maltotriose-dependent transcriptional regulator MalT